MKESGARGTHRRFVQAGLVLVYLLCASCEARKNMIAMPDEVGAEMLSFEALTTNRRVACVVAM